MDMFANPEVKDKRKPTETYPWTLADEAVETAKSIVEAEDKTKKKLTAEGVRNGGMDMIFSYDNTHSTFERNTPQGNTWYNSEKLNNRE